MINYALYALKLITPHEFLVMSTELCSQMKYKCSVFSVPQIFVFFPTYVEYHLDSCRPVSIVS
jgi:hypothetical protein